MIIIIEGGLVIFYQKEHFEIILQRIDIKNEELIETNVILTKAVQNFILSTNRFTTMDSDD